VTETHARSEKYASNEGRTRRLLVEAAEARCPQRRQELREHAVTLNRPMALAVVRAYHGRGIEDDDIDQVAMLGLWKAVIRYVSSPDSTFAAYAIPTIKGEVKRHFRDRGWLVRPIRRVQEQSLALAETTSMLRHRLGREPNDQDLIGSLNISTADLEQARHAQRGYSGVSLDAPQPGATQTLAETLPDTDDVYEGVDTTDTLRWAVDQLPDRDRLIVRLRYNQELSQSDIGGQLGVSQMQVSRLLTRIHRRLRESLTLQAS
jgi:RNA polymerase sigma-B factor